MIGSVRVCVSVRLSVGALLFELFDLVFWHDCRSWPWLFWDCRSRSRSNVENCLPAVQSRSILGLGLPNSTNGNCEWPLPVHWNCLFVRQSGGVQRAAHKRSISCNYFCFKHAADIAVIRIVTLVAYKTKKVGMVHNCGDDDDDDDAVQICRARPK